MRLKTYRYSVTKGVQNIRTKTALIISALGLAVAGTGGLSYAYLAVAHADATNVVVSPGAMHDWTFVDDQNNSTATATGKLVTGPATPPLGVGSAQLSVTGMSDGQALVNPDYAGTSLDQLSNLKYSSYQTGPTQAISLAFDINYGTGNTGYQGRLVYEPYQNGAVSVGSGWQTWSPLNGSWWSTRTSATGSNGLCPQSSPCTWGQVKANWPNASVSGNVVFKAGSGWSAFTGNVDAFTIGVNGTDTTYNFEPDTTAPVVAITNPTDGSAVAGTVDIRGSVTDANPDHYYLQITDSTGHVVYSHITNDTQSFTDKSLYSWDTTAVADGNYTITLAARDAAGNRDAGSQASVTVTVNNTPDNQDQCKNGGWMTFTKPAFKNQGLCVAFTNHNDGVGQDDVHAHKH